MKLVLVSLGVLILLNSYGQNEQAKAKSDRILLRANQRLLSGHDEEVIRLVGEALALDSLNPLSYFYLVLAYDAMENKEKTLYWIKKSLEKQEILTVQCYQEFGSIYEAIGDWPKAIAVYKTGLKKFPDEGVFYFNLGNLTLSLEKDTLEALKLWEAGIQKAPGYSSNYFNASKIYLSSNSVLGLIYGEIFINIEWRSDRTMEMSSLIFSSYKSFLIEVKKKETSYPEPLIEDEFERAFKETLQRVLTDIPLQSLEHLDLRQLHRIREVFLEKWFGSNMHSVFPDNQFNFLSKVKIDGFLEPYNYWLFIRGKEEEFWEWEAKNRGKFDAFLRWFRDQHFSERMPSK